MIEDFKNKGAKFELLELWKDNKSGRRGQNQNAMITPYYYFMNYNRQNTYYDIYSVEIRHHIFKGINKFKNSNLVGTEFKRVSKEAGFINYF